jgi:predicted ribosome quality control (RQC) complex YloA/Tae2 family protein
MGFFSSKPSKSEVKAFARGKTVNARAAEQYAQKAAAKERAKQAEKAVRAARKKGL